MVCNYGCGGPAYYTFKNGKRCCSPNSSSCTGMKLRNSKTISSKRSELGNDYWKNGHPRGMAGKQPYNKNMTYEQLFGRNAFKIKQKISNSTSINSINSWQNLSEKRKQEIKDELSKKIQLRYENGWQPKAGKCKKYEYTSEIAGQVKLDGTWELIVAKWLDLQGSNWVRNTKRFPYTNLKGNIAYYTPDFWVHDIGYLEIKGYKTDLDERKWKQFPHKLTVWYEDSIRKIRAELDGYSSGRRGRFAKPLGG